MLNQEKILINSCTISDWVRILKAMFGGGDFIHNQTPRRSQEMEIRSALILHQFQSSNATTVVYLDVNCWNTD